MHTSQKKKAATMYHTDLHDPERPTEEMKPQGFVLYNSSDSLKILAPKD
jgi:hypothetical protein